MIYPIVPSPIFPLILSFLLNIFLGSDIRLWDSWWIDFIIILKCPSLLLVIILLQSCNNQYSRYSHKNRHINQWKRIESSDVNSYIYDQSIFDKVLSLFNRERIVSSIVVVQITGWGWTPTSYHIRKVIQNNWWPTYES